MEAIENAARRHSVLEQESEGLLGEILGTGKGS